jgi:phage shock protein C
MTMSEEHDRPDERDRTGGESPSEGPTSSEAASGETAELPKGTAAQAPGAGEGRAERPRRRLLRSESDRVIFGVCGGLGEQFGADSLIFRLGFAATILFGGIGVFLYLALALLVPSDDGSGNPQAPVERSRTLAVIVGVAALIWLLSVDLFFDVPFGLLWLAAPALLVIGVWAMLRERPDPLDGRGVALATLLVLVVSIGLVTLAGLALVIAAFGHGALLAAAVIAGGLALIALALAGLGGRWLIAPLLAVAVGAATAAAADLDWDGSIGERSYRPVELAAVPSDGYGLGVGRLEIDLREIEWRPGDVLDLGVRVGAGEVVIAVPEAVCVEARVETEAGELWVAGQRSTGIGVDTELIPPPSPAPRLVLDAEVQVGEFSVLNDDGASLRNHHHGRADDAASARNDAACAAPARPGEGAGAKAGERRR